MQSDTTWPPDRVTTNITYDPFAIIKRGKSFKRAFYTNTDSDTDSDGATRGQLNTRGRLKHKAGRRPKCPRTDSPKASDVSEPNINDGDNNNDGDIEILGKVKLNTGLNNLELKINLADILTNSKVPVHNLWQSMGLDSATIKRLTSQSGVSSQPNKRTSFTHLPDELTEKIYTMVFISSKPINFTRRDGFEHSAQFLRTCRKVHEEGTQILYGKNEFHFSRAHFRRGKYFEPHWKEVGYKDVRRFFRDIGPHNMAKLSKLSFTLEDAMPSQTAELTIEERKFVNDPVVFEVLKMVATNCLLDTFKLTFSARVAVNKKDYHILRAICAIRCHKFTNTYVGWRGKIDTETWNEIKKLVEVPAGAAGAARSKFAASMFMQRGQ